MENNKFKDVRLRQAMAYAIDRKEKSVTNYIMGYATQLILLSHHLCRSIIIIMPAHITKDVEKAKKLLDEAGYKDKNGDGFREDPKGNEFKINLPSNER